MGLFDFLKTKELKEIETLKKKLDSNKTLNQLNKEIEEKKSELASLNKELEGLKLNKALGSDSSIPQKLSINEFRDLFTQLIDKVPASPEKDALLNFKSVDISSVDLAKARFDLIEVQKQIPTSDLKAVINADGKISWETPSSSVNSKLTIGTPKLRTEYYSAILALMKEMSIK